MVLLAEAGGSVALAQSLSLSGSGRMLVCLAD